MHIEVRVQGARELAPRSAVILGDTVFWPFMCRNYDLALSNGQAVTAVDPENGFAQAFLGMSYANQGRVEQALQHADMAVQSDPGPLIASFRANVCGLDWRIRLSANLVETPELRPRCPVVRNWSSS
jgi:tetratricopeptide (TPR) repeat protein